MNENEKCEVATWCLLIKAEYFSVNNSHNRCLKSRIQKSSVSQMREKLLKSKCAIMNLKISHPPSWSTSRNWICYDFHPYRFFSFARYTFIRLPALFGARVPCGKKREWKLNKGKLKCNLASLGRERKRKWAFAICYWIALYLNSMKNGFFK